MTHVVANCQGKICPIDVDVCIQYASRFRLQCMCSKIRAGVSAQDCSVLAIGRNLWLVNFGKENNTHFYYQQ